jgi:hypothetical protein
MRKIFKQIHPYTALTQRISNIFIDQMLIYFLLFFKYILCWHQNFQLLPRSLAVIKNERVKYKVVLRKYLNTHCIYCVNDFVMGKDALQHCFVKCVYYLHCTNCINLCVYVCATSCCFCNTQTDGMCVCVCACVCVCIYVCIFMYECKRA